MRSRVVVRTSLLAHCKVRPGLKHFVQAPPWGDGQMIDLIGGEAGMEAASFPGPHRGNPSPGQSRGTAKKP
jgi:hypothetical protein